jgi:hypothetical protein
MSQTPLPSPPPSHLMLLQSLLQAGHRPIRVQPASLARWGLTFAFLAMATRPLLSVQALDGRTELQAVVAMLWLGGCLGAVAWWDWRANHRAASRAQETLPFVQGQVSKVWWLLLVAGVLYTGSTFFLGGAYQIYMVWLALIGLGLFLHGLFSQQLVEWAGGSLFLLALVALASGLPLTWHRAVMIGMVGVGLPVLGAMLHRWPAATASLGSLIAQVALFLAAGLLPALLVQQWQSRPMLSAEVPIYSPASLARLGPPDQWPRHVGLHVPAGSPIEFQLDMAGEVLKTAGPAPRLTYTFQQDLDFLFIDGRLSHFVRRPGEAWRENNSWLRINRLEFAADPVSPRGLLVRGNAQLSLGGPP